MGKCKNCFAEIPEDEGLCEECTKIEMESSSDDYLNSLLSSVDSLKDGSINSEDDIQIMEEINEDNDTDVDFDMSDMFNFIENNESDDKIDVMNEVTENYIGMDPKESDEDIFAKKSSGDSIIEVITEELPDETTKEAIKEAVPDESMIEAITEETSEGSMMDTISYEILENDSANRIEEPEQNLQAASIEDNQDGFMDDFLKDIFGSESGETENSSDVMSLDESASEPEEFMEKISEPDDSIMEANVDPDDLLSFLNDDSFMMHEENDSSGISLEEADADVFSLDDLLGIEEEVKPLKTGGDDIGSVFSDALGAVSSLDDVEEEAAFNKIVNAKQESSRKENTQEKKAKKKESSTKNKKEKKGLFARLFGNVVDEKEIAEAKKKEEKQKAEKELKEAKKRDKKNSNNEDGTEEGSAPKGIKALLGRSQKSKSEKKDIKEQKLAKKKEKKEKKLAKKKEKISEEPENELDEGRINKVGTAIVFTFLGLVMVGILAGTDVFSYSQTISKATKDFEIRKYNDAYEEISGVKIREKDIELSDKIMTVMFVNKQLNSYNNYYAVKAYPEALDSLLKGLKRYDKYIDLAKKLGIVSDLNYVRAQIIQELNKSYQLTEQQADDIINSKDQTEYSIKVHNTALENSPQPKEVTK